MNGQENQKVSENPKASKTENGTRSPGRSAGKAGADAQSNGGKTCRRRASRHLAESQQVEQSKIRARQKYASQAANLETIKSTV